MKIFDKAQWHIDSGEDQSDVVAKFKKVFLFLNIHNMLSTDGLEIYELGIDSSVSLNEKMVTQDGKNFLEKYYDEVINFNEQEIFTELERRYSK